MADYLFDLPEPPTLGVSGTDALYPVTRIFCVGRNYAEHAREMGHEVDREAPFYFTKPASALTRSGATIPCRRQVAAGGTPKSDGVGSLGVRERRRCP